MADLEKNVPESQESKIEELRKRKEKLLSYKASLDRSSRDYESLSNYYREQISELESQINELEN
jgi:hypothetical protein